jgi:hypothetical protein
VWGVSPVRSGQQLPITIDAPADELDFLGIPSAKLKKVQPSTPRIRIRVKRRHRGRTSHANGTQNTRKTNNASIILRSASAGYSSSNDLSRIPTLCTQAGFWSFDARLDSNLESEPIESMEGRLVLPRIARHSGLPDP